jgi:hypothetical protein
MAFNPLSLLLGQQMSSLIDPEEVENVITVTGPQSRPEASAPNFSDPPPREQSQSRYVLNDDRIAPRPEELKEILPRRGMFGMKGTLRDIVGTLGDAFLVQSGNKSVYAPQRERERQGDAMFGASQDPMQAAERLAAMGDVEGARQLIEQTQQNEYRQGSLSSLEGSRQDQAANRRRDDVRVGRNQVARWLQAADTPAKQEIALRLAARLADELGVTVEDLGPDADLSEDERAVLGAGDMTVNQQVTVPFTERRVSTGEFNAQTGRINANRPRNPPPRPRADTDQEYYRDISNVPENERTPDERAWVNMYINGRGRSGRGSRIGNAPPPPPSGQPANRFRRLN